jgi:hypothetical protein
MPITKDAKFDIFTYVRGSLRSPNFTKIVRCYNGKLHFPVLIWRKNNASQTTETLDNCNPAEKHTLEYYYWNWKYKYWLCYQGTDHLKVSNFKVRKKYLFSKESDVVHNTPKSGTAIIKQQSDVHTNARHVQLDENT